MATIALSCWPNGAKVGVMYTINNNPGNIRNQLNI